MPLDCGDGQTVDVQPPTDRVETRRSGGTTTGRPGVSGRLLTPFVHRPVPVSSVNGSFDVCERVDRVFASRVDRWRGTVRAKKGGVEEGGNRAETDEDPDRDLGRSWGCRVVSLTRPGDYPVLGPVGGCE